MKTDVIRHFLEKKMFLVVSQEKYVPETQFFSCSKKIYSSCVHIGNLFIFAVVPMDSSLFFVQMLKQTFTGSWALFSC